MKIINRLIIIFAFKYCCITTFTNTVLAESISIDNISFNNYLNPIDIYATSYTWYYKVVDGKLYKRLHNDTSAKWESDWIYVRDV